MKSTTKQWAWGPSAHWKLYFSLKRFSKKFYYNVSSGVESSHNQSSYSNNGSSRDDILTNSSRRLYTKPRRVKVGRPSFVRCFSSSSSCNSASRSEIFVNNDQVNQAIWKNENVILFDSPKGLRCETNQLASNQPNEDQLFVTRSYLKEGDVLVGVIDGHGGSTLGKVIKARLPYYLHSSLCDKNLYLENSLTPIHLVENMLNDDDVSINDASWTNDLDVYMNDLLDNNDGNLFSSYVSRLMGSRSMITNQYENSHEGITEAIRTAFMRLDHDLIREVRLLSEKNQLDSDNLGLALSGCCALVAYIMEDELFVANSGDCRAILGSNINGSWSSVQLTCDHTAGKSNNYV